MDLLPGVGRKCARAAVSGVTLNLAAWALWAAFFSATLSAADGPPGFGRGAGAVEPAAVSAPAAVRTAAEGEGFYSFQELGGARLAGAWAATGHIQFTFPSSCSGFYVSKDHFLTALHCLHNCNSGNGRNFVTPSMGHLYMNMAPFARKPEEFYCAEATLAFGAGPAESIRAQVIAAGNGAAITRAANFSEFSAEQLKELQKMKAFQSDWALLKVSRPSETPVCVRTGDLKEGEKVWGIGYPAAAQRKHHSSDGAREYITAGERSRNGFYGNAWLKHAKLNGEIVGLMGNFYSDRMHWVTSDAHTGMSGGGLFDAGGRALGVYAVLMVDGDHAGRSAGNTYFSGSNGYLKMSHILNEAKSLLGEEKVREIFTCVNE